MPESDQSNDNISAPLLCCICQDQNTTFRYEVVYKQANKSITILDITDANKEELELLTEDSTPDRTDSGAKNSVDDSSETAEYYNFPPKHPRHGHLKWPLVPVTSTSEGSYPDYPIHIPTFTLQRINNLLANKARRGNGAIIVIITIS